MPYPYTDNIGLEHDSYEAACHYYGADTPAQVAAEEVYYADVTLAWAASVPQEPPMLALERWFTTDNDEIPF